MPPSKFGQRLLFMINSKPHILFVCGRNQWRSPTAARIYANDNSIEARSAGLSPKSRHQLNSRDIEWADLIIVMEQNYQARIHGRYRDFSLPPIESLDIVVYLKNALYRRG